MIFLITNILNGTLRFPQPQTRLWTKEGFGRNRVQIIRNASLFREFVVVWAAVPSNHWLAALDFRAGVEQPFGCFIVKNRQAVQSVETSMDWTLWDDMVDGLFICATLTGRRGDHTSFVQTGAETSDTDAEAVKPDARCSWEDHYGREGGCRCRGWKYGVS